MKLYHHPLSGHAHRAHLFLSLAGIPHELMGIDFSKGDLRQASYLAKNAFGEIPVLEDDGIVIADSNAILIYAGRKVGPSHWLPTDIVKEAEVQRWLSLAAGKIAYGACAARLFTVFGAKFDINEVVGRAHDTIAVIDKTLQDRNWIAGTEEPTIADVALYSYVARAPERNVDISGYGNVATWLCGIEAFPRFVPFTRTIAGLQS